METAMITAAPMSSGDVPPASFAVAGAGVCPVGATTAALGVAVGLGVAEVPD